MNELARANLIFQNFLSDFQNSDIFDDLLEFKADRSYHDKGMYGLSHDQIIDAWLEYLDDLAHLLRPDQYQFIFDEIRNTRKRHVNNKTLSEII